MSLFHIGKAPALDANGDPISGATWNFYDTGTTTPRSVYANASLGTSLGAVVTANSAGRFVPIFFDDTYTYRAVLEDAGGTPISGFDIDPANEGLDSIGDYSAISESASAAANLTTINAELAAISAAGGGVLHLTPGDYPMTGALVLKDNVKIRGNGAILTGTGLYLFAAQGVGADDWEISDLTLETGVSENFAFRLFDVNRFVMRNIRINRDGNGGYTGMFIGATFGTITDFSSTGSNGIWIEGHDLTFANGNMTAGNGGDDCLVIKAGYISAGDPRTSSYNITINNWIASGYVGAVSIGSEIGYYQVNDATYARAARNITITNCTARNCQGLVFIKPGANAGADYRDGTVENITISNCTIEDLAGATFQAGIYIWAGRGARVRNIRISNIVARVRALTNTAVTNAGVKIEAYDYTGGTAATRIEDIFIDGLNVIDAYDGAPNSGGAPGYPVDWGVVIQNQTGSGGTTPVIGRIEFTDLYVNGTRRNAVYVGTGLTGPFKINGAVFKNFNHTGTAASDRGAIDALTKVSLKNIDSIPSSSAPADVRAIISDNATSKSTVVMGETLHIDIGDVAVTTTIYRAFVAAERAVWISKIEFVNRAAIAADGTNKVTITVDNKDTVANLTTKDSNTGFAVAAWTPASIAGADQFTGANSILTKGKALDITVTTAGTVALAGAAIIVHYVPYGAI